MAKLTSRERVQSALAHQEPDRVPFDLGSGTSTSILVEGYDALKQHLGLGGETRILNKAFRIARLDEPVMQRLGSDFRPVVLGTPMRWSPPPSAPGTFVDLWGVTWKQTYYSHGYYWEAVGHPLAEATIDDLERYPWPDPLDPGFTAGLAEEAKALYEGTSYALVGDGGFKSFWEGAYLLRGFEQMLVDVMTDQEFASALLGKLLEINLAGTGRYLEAVGRYLQVFRAGDDLATQAGPLMSPATFRRVLKPVYKQYFDFVHAHTDAKVFFHSCGNVAPLIDDLAEVGVDALNPVQVSALGDTAALKARYGHKMSFWGGVDTQHVLPHGTAEDVRAEVRRRIRDLGPGGGLVLAAVHNIQPDVPPQNIVAMAEAVREFGAYPVA